MRLAYRYTPADTSPNNLKWRVTVIVYRPAWACTGALTILTTWAGPSMEIGTRTTSPRFRYGTPSWTCLWTLWLDRPVGIRGLGIWIRYSCFKPRLKGIVQWCVESCTISNNIWGLALCFPRRDNHQNLLSLPASPLVFLDVMKNFELLYAPNKIPTLAYLCHFELFSLTFISGILKNYFHKCKNKIFQNLSAIYIHICIWNVDPDPATQINADPDPKH